MENNNKICCLCKNHTANQTGSHIFTHWLIKGAINQVGYSSKRINKEIAFKFSSDTTIKSYFGAGVLPEKIQEIRKNEMSEEDIENNKDFFTCDYIVCTDCEKRFTIAENYFLEKIYNPLQKTNISTDNATLPFTNISSKLTLLFCLIQIWRASIVNFDGFTLSEKTEELIRNIIDKSLNGNETIKTIENIDFGNFYYTIFYVKTDVTNSDKAELTSNLIYVYENEHPPYFFLINDLIILFFTKKKQTHKDKILPFKMSELINRKEQFMNGRSQIKINIINNSRRSKLVEMIVQRFIDNMAKEIRNNFIHSFNYTYGRLPSEYEVNMHIGYELLKFNEQNG